MKTPPVQVTTQTTNGEAPVPARARDVTGIGFEVALFGEAGGDLDNFAQDATFDGPEIAATRAGEQE